jgi:hypothetical protein
MFSSTTMLIYAFGKNEENMDMSRIHLSSCRENVRLYSPFKKSSNEKKYQIRNFELKYCAL